MIDTENKGARLLDMYERLNHGEVISKGYVTTNS